MKKEEEKKDKKPNMEVRKSVEKRGTILRKPAGD